MLLDTGLNIAFHEELWIKLNFNTVDPKFVSLTIFYFNQYEKGSGKTFTNIILSPLQNWLFPKYFFDMILDIRLKINGKASFKIRNFLSILT